MTKEEQSRFCRECLKHSDTCLCGFPWPTKVAAYSRAIFENDMRMIDWFSATVSEAHKKGKIDGFAVVKLEATISELKRKCSNKLFTSRLMASDRKAPTYKEAMDTQMARDAQHKRVETSNASREHQKTHDNE